MRMCDVVGSMSDARANSCGASAGIAARRSFRSPEPPVSIRRRFGCEAPVEACAGGEVLASFRGAWNALQESSYDNLRAHCAPPSFDARVYTPPDREPPQSSTCTTELAFIHRAFSWLHARLNVIVECATQGPMGSNGSEPCFATRGFRAKLVLQSLQARISLEGARPARRQHWHCDDAGGSSEPLLLQAPLRCLLALLVSVRRSAHISVIARPALCMCICVCELVDTSAFEEGVIQIVLR